MSKASSRCSAKDVPAAEYASRCPRRDSGLGQHGRGHDTAYAPRVFLLTGVAGSGKSSIAHTIAYRFALLERLGASFAFERKVQVDNEKRKAHRLIPTLAVDLADFGEKFGIALKLVIGGQTDLRKADEINVQFSTLITEPLKKLSDDVVGIILIVIDALDECDNGDEPRNSRRGLLQTFCESFTELPTYIRILITSRPEPDIVEHLTGKTHPPTGYAVESGARVSDRRTSGCNTSSVAS